MLVAHSCLALCNSMDYTPPGSSVHILKYFICIYKILYIYTHTHTHTHIYIFFLKGLYITLCHKLLSYSAGSKTLTKVEDCD